MTAAPLAAVAQCGIVQQRAPRQSCFIGAAYQVNNRYKPAPVRYFHHIGMSIFQETQNGDEDLS